MEVTLKDGVLMLEPDSEAEVFNLAGVAVQAQNSGVACRTSRHNEGDRFAYVSFPIGSWKPERPKRQDTVR